MTRIGPTRLRVLALILEAQRQGQPTNLHKIAREIGCYPHNVCTHAHALRREGLADFEPYLIGTLRPTCRFIPADRLDADSPPA